MQDLRLTEGLVSIINQKFEYLKKVSDQELLLEIIPLYNFLLSTPQVLGIIQKSNIELQNEINQFNILEEEVQQEIKKLKDIFVSKYPDLDDSDCETPMSPETFINYQFTFKRFENLLNGILEGMDRGTPVENLSLYDNQSNIKKALDILESKVKQKIQELDSNGQIHSEDISLFFLNLKNVANRYDYAYKKLINYKRVSFSSSMNYVERLVKEINPEPQIYNTVEDFMCTRLLPSTFEDARNIVYNDYHDWIPKIELIDTVRRHLERVHSGLLNGITQNLLHEQVISKYKTRCMWYDKARTRSLLLDKNGKLIRGKEDTLVKEMARYLFDNGYPVLFHVRTENLETDLMDPSQKYPLLIEGKAYSSSVKSNLLRGIAQLHAYMNNFETTHYYIPDAYFVVFRISGPVYDFPKEILTNRYRIIPVIIDLGDSSVSGSKQQNQPIVIKHEDIIHQIEEEEKEKEEEEEEEEGNQQ
ncbi:hypothetical protein [Bacillus cereus group sp. BfR-BA-01448]|uniref:hypothetical protein n=1 Tax=Bacillus cereus group sp. BfR-BA-01448 TaxID=2920352 RepID=UPI001F5A333E|nr:hypothetical protein [Bacillus cereus group sp. BfR-BA-01448]